MKDGLLCFTTAQQGGERQITEVVIKNARSKTKIVLLPFIARGSLRLVRETIAQCLTCIHSIRSTKPTVIYSSRLLPLWIAYYLFPKAKRVFHFHGQSYGQMKMEQTLQILYVETWLWLNSKIEKSAITHAHIIVIPSKNAQDTLTVKYPQLNPKQMIIVPNGIDSNIFHLNRNVTLKQQLLWVGRISPEKNPYLLLQLAKKLHHLTFILVYSESHSAYEMNFLKQATKTKNLHFKKNLAPVILANLYQESLLTLLTSTSEVQPLVFLESIACGTPVMTGPLPTVKKLHPPNAPLYLADWNLITWMSAIKKYRPSSTLSHFYREQTKNYSTENLLKKMTILL